MPKTDLKVNLPTFKTEDISTIRNFPQELRDRPQWVAWNTRKHPINPHTGNNASPVDLTTWGTFDQACDCAVKRRLAGVGYVFAEDDPYFGIDLDGCIDPNTGEPEEQARIIIDKFNSYTEVSPSGRGFHIFGRGRKPSQDHSRKDWIELYDRKRYFTVTGRIEGDYDTLKGCQDVLNTFFSDTFGSLPHPKHTPPLVINDGLSDDELIQKAISSRNGSKFESLWYGQWEQSGYPSQSEADLALCSHLAFWTNRNADAIDQLFRRSGLMRSKWDEMRGEHTYGQTTILNAINSTQGGYTGSTGRVTAGTTQKSHGSSVLSLQPHTDYGNAERLVAMFGNDIRYDEDQGLWFVWDKKRWCKSKGGQLTAKAKATIRQTYREAIDTAEKEGQPVKDIPLTEWARKSESKGLLQAMVFLTQDEVPITTDELDSNPMLLNVQNGTIDLTTGQIRKQRRVDYITQLAPVGYDLNATCPQWEHFLDRIFNGNQSLISYLQRAVGYSITGSIKEHILLFLYGSGANGKSTFLSVLTELLGDYAWVANDELLLSHKSSQHPTRIAELFHRRFVSTTEVSEGRSLDEPLFKRLTGERKGQGRWMRQDAFEFNFTHTLWLAANDRPKVKGTNNAVWRRIKLIPFTVIIPDAEQDKDLTEKLLMERSGILNWIIKGCLQWQQVGLSEAPEITNATNEYRKDEDVILRFIDDCCITQEDAYVTKKNLYDAFEQWYEENIGKRPLSVKVFSRRLKEKGFSDKVVRTYEGLKRAWYGLGLCAGSAG